MTASEALARLKRLGVRALTTADAAAALGSSVGAANKTLARLSLSGHVQSIRHGLWSISASIDPYELPDYLTAPNPSYVSLQSALYLHGMISQVPEIVFVVSLDRTQIIRTQLGTYSVHHIAPDLFGGYEWTANHQAKVATPEKALFDLMYFAGTRSRIFSALPELELPRSFRKREVDNWIKRIEADGRAVAVRRRWERIAAMAARISK